MQSESNQTRIKLASISDSGFFESLAAAVLRQAEPRLYSTLIETGTNSAGKAVASPIDGLSLISNSSPPHLVAVHHTTTSREKLHSKWLSNLGDLPKTVRWAASAFSEFPDAQVTLALTTNQSVTEELYRDVHAAARTAGIDVDIWDQTRIADHLDNTADGQWLRRKLGIDQARLSVDLLHKLSLKSLALYTTFEEGERVPRALDRELDQAVQTRGTVFLIAESGKGTSSATRALLKNNVEKGSFGLVIPHQMIEANLTVEAAIEVVLRNLEPGLSEGCGALALELTTLNKKLFLAVEDINKAQSPSSLLERLVSWAGASDDTSDGDTFGVKRSHSWHLICPVWPQALNRLSDTVRKQIEARALYGNSYEHNEGITAVLNRAHLTGASLSLIQARDLAISLGNDPLLIALHNPQVLTSPEAVIGQFIETAILRTVEAAVDTGRSDLKNALFELSCKMLEDRVLTPQWSDIRRWFTQNEYVLSSLQALVTNREIIRRESSGDDDQLTFRHDRVREHLLANAVACCMQIGELNKSILVEPFFAELLGLALLARHDVDLLWVTKLRIDNPLALFCAFKKFQEPSCHLHFHILEAIRTWLADNITNTTGNHHLLWEAGMALAQTDSSVTLELVELFPKKLWPLIEARFRNGDAVAGAIFYWNRDPSINYPWRDHLIEHALAHHHQRLVEGLNKILRTSTTLEHVVGALYLAGDLALSSLSEAVAIAWSRREYFDTNIAPFVWAGAYCGADNPEVLLEPICDAWAALPNQKQENGRASPRDSVGSYLLEGGFARRGLPDSVVNYFLSRAAYEDLAWPISYRLHKVDHPDVAEYWVRKAGAKWEFFFDQHICNRFGHDKNNRRPCSLASIDRLQKIWSNEDEDLKTRIRAIQLWGSDDTSQHLDLLRKIDTKSLLHEQAIRIRMIAGDTETHADFSKLIETGNRGYWWQFAQFVWSSEFESSLNDELERRSRSVSRGWDESWYESDFVLPELIRNLKTDIAEELLARHWEHLHYNQSFVILALFMSTPITRKLVEQTINECPSPSELLKYLTIQYGLYHGTDSSVAGINQLESLLPYLYYLEDETIKQLWQHCNWRGYHDWRSQHLDKLLAREDMEKEGLSELVLQKQLDELADKNRGISFWVEKYQELGSPFGRTVDFVIRWLRTRRTVAALKLASLILIGVGVRKDLILLEIDGIEPNSMANEILEDTRFALCRRTLQ